MAGENFISTRSMSYDEWKAARRKGIGGSDVAAILGFNKYKSPLDVYMEKIGKAPEVIETPKMKAGTKLENTICEWWAEEFGYRIQRDHKIRIHPKHPELIANVDRLIVGSKRGTGILEAKNTSYHVFRQWENEGLPPAYYCQPQHYMYVTGHRWARVAVLVDGFDLKDIPVEYDPEFVELMEDELLVFWNNHVLKHIPPLVKTEQDIKTLWPSINDNDKEVDVTDNDEVIQKVDQLADIQSQLSILGKQKDDIQLEIKTLMKDGTILTAEGKKLVTWRQGKGRDVFDKKTFQTEHPDIYQNYIKSQPGNRTFLLKV